MWTEKGFGGLGWASESKLDGAQSRGKPHTLNPLGVVNDFLLLIAH